jgi:hypothetical protein
MKNNNHKLTGGGVESGPRQRRPASVRISRRWGEWGRTESARQLSGSAMLRAVRSLVRDRRDTRARGAREERRKMSGVRAREEKERTDTSTTLTVLETATVSTTLIVFRSV